jgi:hypothetical protein
MSVSEILRRGSRKDAKEDSKEEQENQKRKAVRALALPAFLSCLPLRLCAFA